MKQIVKQLTIFIVIGLTYFGIEMVVRGRSDISMIVCAGIIGVIVGLLNDIFSYDMLIQMLSLTLFLRRNLNFQPNVKKLSYQALMLVMLTIR